MPSQLTIVDLMSDTQTEAAPIKYEEVVEKVDDKPTEPVEVVNPSDPVVMKKPRAKPRNPKKKKDEMPDLTLESIQEVQPEVTQEVTPMVVEEPEPVAEPETQETEVDNKSKKKGCYKTVELVACPKCGKKLTERTVKYSHANKCSKNDNPHPEVKAQTENVEKIEVSKDIEPAVTAYAQRLKKD